MSTGSGRESWCQHERGWMECHWEAWAAHRCQRALCPRANGGVMLTRQGRGVYTSRAPQGPLLPCRLSLPLYPCIASPSDQAVKDTLGDTRSTLAGCKTVFFWRMCWCGGAWRSRKKKNKGRHESSNCNSLVNSVQRPINMHLQMCCNTFLLRRWYYAAHVAQQLWISLIWWLLR